VFFPIVECAAFGRTYGANVAAEKLWVESTQISSQLVGLFLRMTTIMTVLGGGNF